jgi:hypothetical protein
MKARFGLRSPAFGCMRACILNSCASVTLPLFQNTLQVKRNRESNLEGLDNDICVQYYSLHS